MTASDVLARIRAAGLHARLDAGRLLVGPAALLTPDLRALVAQHKGELLALLSELPPEAFAAIAAANAELPEPFDRGPVEMREWAVLLLPDWLGGGYSALPVAAFREIAAHNQAAREKAARKEAQKNGTGPPGKPAKKRGAHQTAFLTDRPGEAL